MQIGKVTRGYTYNRAINDDWFSYRFSSGLLLHSGNWNFARNEAKQKERLLKRWSYLPTICLRWFDLQTRMFFYWTLCYRYCRFLNYSKFLPFAWTLNSNKNIREFHDYQTFLKINRLGNFLSLPRQGYSFQSTSSRFKKISHIRKLFFGAKNLISILICRIMRSKQTCPEPVLRDPSAAQKVTVVNLNKILLRQHIYLTFTHLPRGL